MPNDEQIWNSRFHGHWQRRRATRKQSLKQQRWNPAPLQFRDDSET